MKKVFIVSFVLLVVVLIFLGIYNFAFKKKSPVVEGLPSQNEIPDKISLFDFGKDKIYPLADEPVISPVLSEDNKNIIYYSRTSGNVWKISLDGKEKEIISEDNLAGLVDVLWSPNKNKVISKFSKNGENTFYFYDYKTETGTELKSGIDDVVWTSLGNKIVYKYFDSRTKKRTLNIAESDGSNWKELAVIPYRNVSVESIPKTSLISFWNAPDAFLETSFQTVSIAGGEIKTLFSGKFGADYLWAPDGGKVLASFSNLKGGSKITLGVFNSNGGEYKNFGIPTLVSKSVWGKNSKVVYYALPGSIPESSVMPNDYQENKLATQDTFWKVDVNTGKQERVIELSELEDVGENFDAIGLFLSSDEDILFFTNKTDGKLYGINL